MSGLSSTQRDLGRSPRALAPIRDLVAAQRAQPREQRRIAPIGVNLVERPDEGRLRDVFGPGVVAVKPRAGKPVDARKVVRKEGVEGRFVSRRQPASQRKVLHGQRLDVRVAGLPTILLWPVRGVVS